MAPLGLLPVLISVSIVTVSLFCMFGSKKWDPKGKHCFVTGGSSGAGLSLAILLARKGAHISIVARDKDKLREALEQIEAARQSSSQIFKSYSFSLNSLEASKAAIYAACAPHGDKAPDAVFTCAGVSTPGFFVEQTEKSMLDGMTNTYWIQAWPALAATQKMVRDRVHGKIVFVSSILGFMSMVGYNTYAPGKHAIRGLAEGLRSELLLYGIDVQCFFPCTIYSPGLERENRTKPSITLKIEEADSGLTPDQVAQGILKATENGYHHSAVDFLTNVFRASTRGAVSSNNFVVDLVLNLMGQIGIPLWRRSTDKTIRNHRKEHEEYLIRNGFYNEEAENFKEMCTTVS